MGIEGLTRWIREHHPQAISTVELSSFSGRRVAIDATNVLYEMWSSAYRERLKLTNVLYTEVDRKEVEVRCLEKVFEYTRRILSCGVLPVFVFDGDYHEKKRLYAHVRRRGSKDKAREKLKGLEEEIALLGLEGKNIHYLENKRKLLAQVETPEQEMETMKNALFASGLPSIQADYEAEKLCSQLCYEGRVDAVISSDSDNLAHGCLLLITKIRLGEDGEFGEAFSLLTLLESAELTFASFVDLCIMAGCDYNKNIDGIGIGRAYKLLKEHGSIENLPNVAFKKRLDTSILEYPVCREIFSLQKSSKLTSELSLDIVPMDKELLKEYGVFWGDDLERLISALPPIENLFIQTALP